MEGVYAHLTEIKGKLRTSLIAQTVSKLCHRCTADFTPENINAGRHSWIVYEIFTQRSLNPY